MAVAKSNVIREGARLLWRRQRVLWWLYGINLLLAAFGTLPMANNVGAVLNHSLAAEHLVKGFDLTFFAELAAQPSHPRQLHRSSGLIGYSLHAQPLRRRFWTLSVWEDQQSLMSFVRHVPHAKIMQILAPHMRKTQFAQWKVTIKDIPPSWDQAKTRLS